MEPVSQEEEFDCQSGKVSSNSERKTENMQPNANRSVVFGGEMRAASNFSKFEVKSTNESGSREKSAMSGNDILIGKVKKQQQHC